MGALTTAFELTEGALDRTQFERITVYQRGWRLGGKGASSRGPHGRIEEHGLHVLLGYYDHTFDVMRRCYEALDRDRSDPSCPIRTWDDAVAPSNLVGVVDRARRRVGALGGDASAPVTGRPGESAGGTRRGRRRSPMADLVVRSLRLLLDFFASLPFAGRPRRVAPSASAPRRTRRVHAAPAPAGVDGRRRAGRRACSG